MEGTPCDHVETRLPNWRRHGFVRLVEHGCAPMVLVGTHDPFPGTYLTEATYKEIMSLRDPTFLKKKTRSSLLAPIQLRHIIGNTMHFVVKSSEFHKNGTRYTVLVEFEQWDEVGRSTDVNWAEKARLLLWAGDIRLHCTCPAFLYWGFQYLLTAIDASIHPENRKPVIRNPEERGIVCKHLFRVLDSLPFYLGDMARALRLQYATTVKRAKATAAAQAAARTAAQ